MVWFIAIGAWREGIGGCTYPGAVCLLMQGQGGVRERAEDLVRCPLPSRSPVLQEKTQATNTIRTGGWGRKGKLGMEEVARNNPPAGSTADGWLAGRRRGGRRPLPRARSLALELNSPDLINLV